MPWEGPEPGDLFLPSYIVQKQKRDQNRRPVRLKPLLVALGNRQNYGESFTKLHTPGAFIELLIVLMAVSVECGWDVYHVYIKGSFPYTKWPKFYKLIIHFSNVNGFKASNGLYVCLKKSIYGLIRVPNLWHSHLLRGLLTLVDNRGEDQ